MGLFTVLFAGIPWYVTISHDPVMPWWFRIAVYSLLSGVLIVLVTLALEQRQSRKLALEDSTISETTSKFLVINSPEMPGRKSSELLGMVQVHTIFAIWLGKDLSAIVRLILGGE